MALQDWHTHAQHVDPLLAPQHPAPTGQPALSLLPPLSDLIVSDRTDQRSHGTDLPDSDETAIGARIADEIAVLTRVLMGLGLDPEPAPEAAAPAYVVPVLDEVEPLVPTFEAPTWEAPVQEAPLFVAPPVVEVAPLLEVTPEPVPFHAPEPVRTTDNTVILDELAFLDT